MSLHLPTARGGSLTKAQTCMPLISTMHGQLYKFLTHWGRVTHICISKLAIIGSDNGLSPECAKPLSEPVLEYVNWTLGNKLQWNFNWNSNSLIAENTFENVVCECCSFRLGLNVLTLKVRGPSYLGLTSPISWLLMPWLLASPGHQQPWYWLCRIGKFLSYSRGNFNYLCLISVEEWHKM